MTGDPITPTRVIPASGQPIPLPASPPPPPAPPAAPPSTPYWWNAGPGPSGPPPPVPVDVHVTVTVESGGALVLEEPEPGPRWWQRFRLGYNAACAAAGFLACGPWAYVLHAVRAESLAAAWIMAAIPLTVVAFIDNARKVEALHADPDLWAPRVRAALARTALWALALATALALPLTTLVYAITGVHA